MTTRANNCVNCVLARGFEPGILDSWAAQNGPNGRLYRPYKSKNEPPRKPFYASNYILGYAAHYIKVTSPSYF